MRSKRKGGEEREEEGMSEQCQFPPVHLFVLTAFRTPLHVAELHCPCSLRGVRTSSHP